MNTQHKIPGKPKEDDLDVRLRALDARVNRNRAANEPEGSSKSDSTGFGNGLRLSSEFVSAILVGAAIGYAIDYLAGTSPWAMIIFMGLGFVAGVLNMLRAANKMSGSYKSGRK